MMVAFVAALYVIEFVNATFFNGTLYEYGIRAHHVWGLLGIIWAPLLHASWAHLIGNTLPVLVFGFLAMAVGFRAWIATTATIWLVSGLGVWLLSPPNAVTIGASGIAFGWLAFLLVRGLFNRAVGQILLALVLLFFWGGVLLGLLPGGGAVSWQAHLFGALGGVLAAWLSAMSNRRKALPSGSRTPGNLAA